MAYIVPTATFAVAALWVVLGAVGWHQKQHWVAVAGSFLFAVFFVTLGAGRLLLQ